MWLTLVAAMTANANPTAVEATLQVMTDRQQSWAHRKQALEQLRQSDPHAVLFALLPWIPPVDRERPAHFPFSAGPPLITTRIPFEEQLAFCVHELVSDFVLEPLPSPELGRWLARVLSSPDGEDRFARMVDASFRHSVPELEAPVATILRDGKRRAARTIATHLLLRLLVTPRPPKRPNWPYASQTGWGWNCRGTPLASITPSPQRKWSEKLQRRSPACSLGTTSILTRWLATLRSSRDSGSDEELQERVSSEQRCHLQHLGA